MKPQINIYKSLPTPSHGIEFHAKCSNPKHSWIADTPEELFFVLGYHRARGFLGYEEDYFEPRCPDCGEVLSISSDNVKPAKRRIR